LKVGKHVSHTLIYRSGEREGRKVGKEGKGRERKRGGACKEAKEK